MNEYNNKSELLWYLTKEDVINDMKESFSDELNEEDFNLVRKYFSWELEQPRDIFCKTISEELQNRKTN
ncbi:hypothetical protein D9V86_00435 [Bacteroidetes/Chlorobi group bacterium ChocPot_Mid]|nr:MAG: hypothetical protein D9V86_00435 [Bacteroidetes/Chlorobi group bacterium ChocPot_Mid]